MSDNTEALTAENIETELDEVLAALARVTVCGAQQFEERRRRFIMLARAAIAQQAAPPAAPASPAPTIIESPFNSCKFRGACAAYKAKALAAPPAAQAGDALPPTVDALMEKARDTFVHGYCGEEELESAIRAALAARGQAGEREALIEVVGQILDAGHLNTEDLARLRAAWERAA